MQIEGDRTAQATLTRSYKNTEEVAQRRLKRDACDLQRSLANHPLAPPHLKAKTLLKAAQDCFHQREKITNDLDIRAKRTRVGRVEFVLCFLLSEHLTLLSVIGLGRSCR